jgi:hypothetical protein
MSEYKFIKDANTFHDRLIREKRVIESTYQGLKVYKINLSMKGSIEKYEINSNDYFYTVSTIQNYIGEDGWDLTKELLADALKPENISASAGWKMVCLRNYLL